MPLFTGGKGAIFYFMTKIFFFTKSVDKIKLLITSVYNSVDIVDNLLLNQVFAY